MKKRVILLSLTVLVLSALLFSFTAGAVTLGDVDGDNVVSVLDATMIQKHLASILTLTAEQKQAGMVENGKTISVIDATLIQKKLASIIDHFPVQDLLPPTEEATALPTQPLTEAATIAPTQPATEKEEVTKVSEKVDIYFSNNKNWTAVNAYLYSSETGDNASAWPGSAMKLYTTNSYDEKIYKMTVDVSKFDRVIFNNGSAQTTDTPVTKASSGYFIMAQQGKKFVAGVYPYGQNNEGSIKTIQMEYAKGYNKNVYIWTPEGYNAEDKTKKYSVLYMCDGQNLFDPTIPRSAENEWECDESVLSLMQNGGDGVIVVGIDNSNNKRDSELTPNLGKVSAIAQSYGSYENGTGAYYADFVVHKVVPYIEENYNTNLIRGIAGSSSGGIEAFYIGIENMDMFRYIGALSPAFVLYDEDVWSAYLNQKDFTGDVPRIYIYNGKGDALEKELYKNAFNMVKWLKAAGYDGTKIYTAEDTDATHNELFWALYFPEMLSFGLDV
ncbi:MAG: starch-binding protein [Ruminococcus sp.]|nr:starch-binding protein [Ruminococcus sp.]